MIAILAVFGFMLILTATANSDEPATAKIQAPTPEPQWITGARLLSLGESMDFRFTIPEGVSHSELIIYPRFLENAKPGEAFKPGGDLDWLKHLSFDTFPLHVTDGRAFVIYTPTETGNYIAKWEAGGETLYRYFSVIDDSYIVLSFSTFWDLEPSPTFHGTGIPLDYRLPVDQFDTSNAQCQKLLGYNRTFGELVVPEFPDTPDATPEQRVKQYGDGMQKVRALMKDSTDGRSARIVMRHNIDPGYTDALTKIGINDHCGLQEANCKPWLGMPEFPYFGSPVDCRKVFQGDGGPVMAHQWDFCGGLHFLGPVAWHYAASEGRFEVALECIRQGMEEFKNLTEMSGHFAMVTPLYDGVLSQAGYPNPHFQKGFGAEGMQDFVRRYLELFAFECTKEYKLVFTRSIDFVDYYHRHHPTTPQTVFVTKTKHYLYDAWWTGNLCNYGVVTTAEKIPWYTKISTVRKMRSEAILPEMQPYMPFKDALSTELLLVEEQKRSIRFERESPNPIWWFDYTQQNRGPSGSEISDTTIPDVEILRSQSFSDETGLTIRLKMQTVGQFTDYAIALWGIPIEFNADPNDIKTDATRYVLAKNTEGETHIVLYFDLAPDKEIELTLAKPTDKEWKY